MLSNICTLRVGVFTTCCDDARLILSGSSEEQTVRLYCAQTGRLIHSAEMYPGRKHGSLYVQSLRCVGVVRRVELEALCATNNRVVSAVGCGEGASGRCYACLARMRSMPLPYTDVGCVGLVGVSPRGCHSRAGASASPQFPNYCVVYFCVPWSPCNLISWRVRVRVVACYGTTKSICESPTTFSSTLNRCCFFVFLLIFWCQG